MKQTLRQTIVNKYIVTYNNLGNFHATRTDNIFCISDITTEFISDWVYWLKHEHIKFEGHPSTPKHVQTKGMADASVETRLKNLKAFVN